jgi:hypothetical protein
MLILPRKADSKSMSFSPYTRHQLSAHWKMPQACFVAHDHLWSGVMTYGPDTSGDQWKGMLLDKHNHPPESHGTSPLTVVVYLVRNDRSWAWACTLVVSHNAILNTTYAVCIDLKESETESLMNYFKSEKKCAGNPLFAPIAPAHLYIRATITINRRHNKDFYDIQTSMKTDYYIKSPKKRRAGCPLSQPEISAGCQLKKEAEKLADF